VNDIEHHVIFPRQRKIALHDVTEPHAGVVRLEAPPECGVDAQDTGDVVAARYNHVLHATFAPMLAQEVIETCICRRDNNIALHDLGR